MSNKRSIGRPYLLSIAALLGTTALSTIAISPALAQDNQSQAPAATSSAQDSENAPREVVITGSRIARRDFTAASPLVTVQSKSFNQISTVGIENVMNQLPQFVPGNTGSSAGPGSGTQFGTGDVQATPFNSPGLSTLNLRGIGAFRNLVLIDGRRGQPANATLVVDVNTIPAAAIDSVEIITGGASAVYGADAVSGVVNFKLKHNYEGMTFDAQSGISQRGDGTESRISALIGANFGSGRGNVMFGAEWDRREGINSIDRKWQRDFWSDPTTSGGAPDYSSYVANAFNHPTQAAVDSVFSNLPAGSVSPTSTFYVNPDGTLFTQCGPGAANYTGPVDGVNTKIGSNGCVQHNFTGGFMSSPLTRYSFFGRAEYNLTDDVTFYSQGMFSDVKVNQILNYAPATSFWIANPPNDAGHPVPPELATLLDNRYNDGIPGVFPPGPVAQDATWSLGRNLDFIGARSSENLTTEYQILAGFKGNLPIKDWTYDIYGSHGQTMIINNSYGFASTLRYHDLVDAPNYGKNLIDTGNSPLGNQISCATGLPMFSDFTPSQDCVNAITANMTNTTKIKQDIVEANFQGGLFNLPAGEVRGALGATYRRDRSVYKPDILLDREGGLFDHPIGLFPSNNSTGSTSVKEVYGELLIPILNDLPAVKNIDLELGGRLSDYKNVGTIETYKALAHWDVTNWLSLRGGYNRANRAPNVAEAYTAPTQSVIFFPGADPCLANTTNSWGNLPSNPNQAQVRALCSALINNPSSQWNTDPTANVSPFAGNFPFEIGITSGNPNLKNETANTITLGAVIRSPASGGVFGNMTTTLDYYSIKIKNEIQQADAWTIYAQCFNVFGDNPTYNANYAACQAIRRAPSTGYRQSVDTQFINTGALHTSGLDVAFAWNIAMEDIGIKDVGSLNVNVQGNYLFGFKQQNAPQLPFQDDAGTLAAGGHYRWRTTTNLTYLHNSWSVGLRWIHLPSIKDATYATDPTTANFPIGSYNNFSLYASWSITDYLTFRAGIDNLVDSNPRRSGVSPTSGGTGFQTTYYDPIGRRFYGGLRFQM